MQRKEMGFNANHFIEKVADFSKTFLQIMHEKYEDVLKGVSDGDTEAHSQARKSFQRGISSAQARTTATKATAELLTKHAKKIDSELIQDRSSSFFFGTIIVSCVCAGILIFLLYSRYKSATKYSTRRPRAVVRESTLRSKRRLSCASKDRAPTISLPLACTVPTTPLVTKVVNDEVKQTIYLNQNFKASESDIQKQIESVVCDIDFDVDSLDTSSFVICCHDTDDDENSMEGRLDLSLPDITGDGKPLDADSYLRQKYLKMGIAQEAKANPIKKCAAMVDLHGGIEPLLDENVNNVGNIESMKPDNDAQMDEDMLSDLCLESESTTTTKNDEKNDDPVTTTKETDVVKDGNDSDSNIEFIETPTQTDFSFLIVSKSQIPDSANSFASMLTQPNSDLGKSEISMKTFDLPMENQCPANKRIGPIKSQSLNYAMARRHSWTGFNASVSPTQSKTSTTTNTGKSNEITKTKDEEDMHTISSCTTTIITTTTSDEHFISRDDVVVDDSQIDQSKDVGDIACEIIGDGPQIADINVSSKNSGDIDRSLSTKTLTESVAAEQCQEIEKSSISETGTMDVICTTIAERSQNAVVSSCSEITTSGTEMNGFSSDDHVNLLELKKELIAEAVELKKQALSVSTNLEVIQNNINKSLEKPKNTNQTQNFKSKIRKFQTKKQPSNVSAETKPLLIRQPSNLNKNKSIPSPRTPLKPPTPRNVLKKVENQIVKPSAVATVKESKPLPILSTLPTPSAPSTPPAPLSPSIPTKSRIPIPTGRKYPSEMAVGDTETPPHSPASAQRRTMSVTPPKQRSQVGEQLRRPLMQRCSSSLNVLAAPPRRLKPINLRNRNSGSGSTSPRRAPAAPKTSACAT